MQRSSKEIEDSIRKLEHFCLFRDRTIKEVLDRMEEYDIPFDRRDELLEALQEDDIVNEERFARQFALGKHRSRKWGRNKIRYELGGKGIDALTILHALDAIDPEEYMRNMESVLEEKIRETKARDEFSLKQKLAQKLTRKGYESDLIWDLLKRDR